mgnify:CR=1 FL=1
MGFLFIDFRNMFGRGGGGRGQKSPKTEARVFGTAPYVVSNNDRDQQL